MANKNINDIVTDIMLQSRDGRNKKGDGDKNDSGSLNIPSAREMARDIEKQLGLDVSSIKKMARNLVATMILQYDPNISTDKIKALVDHMVPDRTKVNIPPEILRQMIEHFTSYARGTMKQADVSDLPKGWSEKYWNHFPDKIKYLIILFIQDEIDRSLFWNAIDTVMTRESGG